MAGHVLAWGRTAMAAGCVGTARAALRLAVSHVTTREQFGHPLGQLPVVRTQMALAAARLYAAQAIVRWASTAEGDALNRRSTSAKVFCSETAWDACDQALQLHGGAGFIEETGVALVLRDARVPRIFEGANDVLLTHAGSVALLTSPIHEPLGPRFADDPLAVGSDALWTRVCGLLDETRREVGVRAMRRPRVLHQLGRCVVLADAARAATLRALVEGTSTARHSAALFLTEAHHEVEHAARPLPPEDAVVGLSEHLYEAGP